MLRNDLDVLHLQPNLGSQTSECLIIEFSITYDGGKDGLFTFTVSRAMMARF